MWKEKWIANILSGYWNYGYENAHQRIMASGVILESPTIDNAIWSLNDKFESTGDDFYLWAASQARPEDAEPYEKVVS
ncbi:hypothetical protein KC669_04870 [Candidatus Dojkabacteria bacterium]|uniref:Uncharacterized protein n=1 Tax=Candidatus Dojkabacteria bacterium TaxID=2099670 RepID=A0A955RLR5_9BACT|nr:hypothetical protein [Candidatus Dojkabacteria bacterium]